MGRGGKKEGEWEGEEREGEWEGEGRERVSGKGRKERG